MSKAMETCLLHIIVVAAEQHVKQLVEAGCRTRFRQPCLVE